MLAVALYMLDSPGGGINGKSLEAGGSNGTSSGLKKSVSSERKAVQQATKLGSCGA